MRECAAGAYVRIQAPMTCLARLANLTYRLELVVRSGVAYVAFFKPDRENGRSPLPSIRRRKKHIDGQSQVK